MTRQQMIEDFYFAVKRYLVNEGRSEEIAADVATKAVAQIQKLNVSIEDIKRMRDVFIA